MKPRRHGMYDACHERGNQEVRSSQDKEVKCPP